MGEGNLNITEPEDSIDEYYSQHYTTCILKLTFLLHFWKKEIRTISKQWLQY